MEKRKIFAFTLAEVLITIGIIGVVAAITIPILVKNYQNSQTITGLKKAYTEFNQAITQLTNDYNCPNDLACTGIFDAVSDENTDNTNLTKEFMKYFKVLKDCSSFDNNGQAACWPVLTYRNYDGTGGAGRCNGYTSCFMRGYGFLTTDGMSFRIGSGRSSCIGNGSYNRTGDMKKICGQIMVDINGLKGPNYMGVDTFMFWITNGKSAILYPIGGSDDGVHGAWNWNYGNGIPSLCAPVQKDGGSCAGRIIDQGWKINY